MKNHICSVAILFLSCGISLSAQAKGKSPAIEQSVVKILNAAQAFDFSSPWKPGNVQRSTGTGFVIAGNRIMTNAHVVSWAKRLEVTKHNDPTPYTADVEYVGHDCDLAVIKPRDPAFFTGTAPLPIGDLPELRSQVTTYGYPAGGQTISFTRGVVSRIEYNLYVHSGSVSLLNVQTDAAINPGNSGGPVMQGNKVVGVAFQGIGSLENTGFFIPTTIVQHFLKDIADGTYDGFPDFGAYTSELQNPAYRNYLALPAKHTGVVVDTILPNTAEAEVLKTKDVIIELAGRPIAPDGTVLYRGHRVSFTVGIDDAQVGEVVRLKVWRDKHEHNLLFKVSRNARRYAKFSNIYDVQPRYTIYAGLIFVPLQREYLKLFGASWYQEADDELLHHFWELPQINPRADREEWVVMSKTLPAPINTKLNVKGNGLVDKINGTRIERLEDVRQVFSSTAETFRIEYTNGAVDIIDRKQAEEQQPQILKLYGIGKDYSL